MRKFLTSTPGLIIICVLVLFLMLKLVDLSMEHAFDSATSAIFGEETESDIDYLFE